MKVCNSAQFKIQNFEHYIKGSSIVKAVLDQITPYFHVVTLKYGNGSFVSNKRTTFASDVLNVNSDTVSLVYKLHSAVHGSSQLVICR